MMRLKSTLLAGALGVLLLAACRGKTTKNPTIAKPTTNLETQQTSSTETASIPTSSSQKKTEKAAAPGAAVKRPIDLEEGKRLFYLRRCNTCHKTKGRLAMRGPSLASVAKRLSREAMKGWILNPRRQKPDTLMPVFDGTDEELETILDFLLSLK